MSIFHEENLAKNNITQKRKGHVHTAIFKTDSQQKPIV